MNPLDELIAEIDRLCRQGNSDDFTVAKIRSDLRTALFAFEHSSYRAATPPTNPVSTDGSLPWNPEIERVRKEMMRRFSDKLSMEEIASFAYETFQPSGVSTAGMTELLEEIIMSANGAIQGAALKPDLHQCGSCIDNWRKLRKLAAHVLAEKGK